jgi:hypothetical protein
MSVDVTYVSPDYFKTLNIPLFQRARFQCSGRDRQSAGRHHQRKDEPVTSSLV